MRLYIFLLSLALGVNAYGGYGAQSPAFKSRVDFEPKGQTLSPVLPTGDTPYNTPPPIPMPDKTQIKDISSESSESKEDCAPNAIVTTTENPAKGCAPSSVGEHIHVDAESNAPLQKVLPPQVSYGGEIPKPVEEVKPALEVAGSFSSATKEEIDLYGIASPSSSVQPPTETPSSSVQPSTETPSASNSYSPEPPKLELPGI
jgi:hypothetical protein